MKIILFDQLTSAKSVNVETFEIEENKGDYYLFATMISPSGATTTYFAPGPLRIDNLGVPRAMNLRFFGDALGEKRDQNRPASEITCCVFTQGGAGTEGTKKIRFAVPNGADQFGLKIDLLRGEAVVQELPSAVEDFTEIPPAEGQAGNTKEIEYDWVPAGIDEGLGYRFKLTITNNTSQKTAEFVSDEFGMYADGVTPSFDGQIAGAASPIAVCSACHTVARNGFKGAADYANFKDFAGAEERDIVSRIMQPLGSNLIMPPPPQAGQAAVVLTAADREAIRLYIKAGSPQEAPPEPMEMSQ